MARLVSAVREPLGGVRAATRGRALAALDAATRAELESFIERVEWAADGGDGSICSTHEADDVRTLDVEWQLHGALLEVMAAIELRPGEADDRGLEESENSPAVAG